MRISKSDSALSLVECINPVRGKWSIRWRVPVDSSDGTFTYYEETFYTKPSPEEVLGKVTSWINLYVKELITTGFVWRGFPVWLSVENQLNYVNLYQTANRDNYVPVEVKFGQDDDITLYTFENYSELEEFYKEQTLYLQSALKKGWSLKTSINWEEDYYNKLN